MTSQEEDGEDGRNQEHIPRGTPPRIDLHDAVAIRRELAAVYRDMRAGRISTQDGTRLAYVLDLARKCHETSVLEDKVQAVETLLIHRK